ncbi:MAG: hypothetical protein LAN37_03375 [Acidobacteriia bacterium]|nr:hypothetical protein [Terriglobia bacterium]
MIRKTLVAWFLLVWAWAATAQMEAGKTSCSTAGELDPAMRANIERAAQQFTTDAVQGNAFNLRQISTGSLAANFGAIEALIGEYKPSLAGGTAKIRSLYLLEARGSQPLETAGFFCGIINSPEATGFSITNLPPGRYAIVIEDITAPKMPFLLTQILKDEGSWKLAGFYLKPTQLAGHDAAWFLQTARDFKARAEIHNAWFYYLAAWDLTSPLDFMSTRQLDRLVDEMAPMRPNDLPFNGPVDLAGTGKSFKVTYVSMVPVDNDLYLLVRYRSPDVSNTQQAYADNVNVIKALTTQYPEYREAFAGVVARATEPSGRDYGSMLAMKDVK